MKITAFSESVDKWFEESIKKIQSSVRPFSKADIHIVGSLLCGRKHAKGCFTLLENSHVLPAMVLVRVMGELYVSLRWCLKDNKTNSADCVWERFMRWDYKRCSEEQRLLKRICKYNPEFNEALVNAEANIAKYNNQGLKIMPDAAGLFGSISKEYENFVYAKFYQLYSRAVHSDFTVIKELAVSLCTLARCVPFCIEVDNIVYD